METCKKKNEQTTMAITKASQPSQKCQKTSLYACHICGLNGYKWQIVQILLRCKRCFMGNL